MYKQMSRPENSNMKKPYTSQKGEFNVAQNLIFKGNDQEKDSLGSKKLVAERTDEKPDYTKVPSQKTIAKSDMTSPKMFRTSKPITESIDPAKEADMIIESTESIIIYFLTNYERSFNFWDNFLNATSIPSSLNFSRLFPNTTEEETMKKHIDFIFKTDHAQKKQVFLNLKKKMKEFNLPTLKDFQAKYEKFCMCVSSTDLKKKSSIELKEPLMSGDNNAFILNSNIRRLVTGEQTEGGFDVKSMTENFEMATKLIQNSFISESEFPFYQKLFKSISNFQTEFQRSLEKFRDKMLIINPPNFQKLEFESNFKAFQQSLDVIYKRNMDFQQFAFKKLSELREQNTQLNIVQNHINKYPK